MRCEATIPTQGGWHRGRCSRKGSAKENGKWWCFQHAPSAEKERSDKRHEQFEAEWEAKKAKQPANVRKAAIRECLSIAEAIETGTVTAGNRTVAAALRALLGES